MKKIDNQAELQRMITDYISGKANAEQKAFLEAYFQYFEGGEDILKHASAKEQQDLEAEMLAGLESRLFAPPPKRNKLWPAVARIAAVLLVLIAIGSYFYRKHDMAERNDLVAAAIVPGGNKAVLTLSNGKRISLDDAAFGQLASQDGVAIKKSADGLLVYDVSNAVGTMTNGIHTITTPRGGEYQVILPDGTKVWLNAESSLSFPAVFKGMERQVTLSGEAYFEVAKNKRKPFLVNAGGQMVEVLGTHFNISAYKEDNNIRTTLLEGSVRVSVKNTTQSMVLKPGQQSAVTKNGLIKLSEVRADDAIAWKNGYFQFDNQSLPDVMKKIARWYDVDIEYNGKLTNENFVGQVSKFDDISDVLAALELTGLAHFKIEGRRVIVMP